MNMLDTKQPTVAVDATLVVGLLSEQRDLCAQLCELAERQRPLITGDEPERLLTVLGERQRLLDRLEVLKQRLEPYQQNWLEIRKNLAPADGEKVNQLVDEVNDRLSKILETDKADAELLAVRKSSTSRSMESLKKNKQVGAAYAAAAVVNAGQPQVDWTDQ